MKIAVASGKGGVGKSMLASALAMLFSKDKKIVAVDCDVDAPNLHLWLGEPSFAKASEGELEKISTSERPIIDHEKCNLCGRCVDICAFNALSINNEQPALPAGRLTINNFFCEGCGACEVVCPQKAIKMQPVQNAEIRVINFDYHKLDYGNSIEFPLVSGQLYPGETGSGKIVDEIKARAENFDYEIMLLDSPAGTGCPIIATLKDVDFAILVTEPTPPGFSDLKRVLTVVNHFQISFGVVINKWDINPELSQKIEHKFKAQMLGKVSYDKRIFQAIANLTPIMETNLPVKKEVEDIFKYSRHRGIW